MRREHVVRVRLNDVELAALDAAAAEARSTRARLLRSWIIDGGSGHVSEPLTRDDALALLERSARRGSVVAQATLARELRLQPLPKQSSGRRSPVRVEDLPLGVLRAVE